MSNIFSGDYTFEAISAVQINKESLQKQGEEGLTQKLLALHHLAYSYYCEKQEHDRFVLELEKNLPLYVQSWMQFFHVFTSTVNTDKHFLIDGKLYLGKNELRRMELEGKKISDLEEEDISDLELMFSEYSGQLRIKEKQLDGKIDEISPRINEKQKLMVKEFFRNLGNVPTKELEKAVFDIIGKDDFIECSYFRDQMIELIRECMLNFYLKVGHDFAKQSPAARSYIEQKEEQKEQIKTRKNEMRRIRKEYNEIGWLIRKDHPELSEVILDVTRDIYNLITIDVLNNVHKRRTVLNKSLILGMKSSDEENPHGKLDSLQLAQFTQRMLQKRVNLAKLIEFGKDGIEGGSLEELIRELWIHYKASKNTN